MMENNIKNANIINHILKIILKRIPFAKYRVQNIHLQKFKKPLNNYSFKIGIFINKILKNQNFEILKIDS